MNITNITNDFQGINNPLDLLAVPNINTGGMAYVGLLGMMQVIIMLALLPYGFLASILSSAFIGLIAGMFLVYMELMTWTWLMFWLAQIIIIIIYVTWQEK